MTPWARRTWLLVTGGVIALGLAAAFPPRAGAAARVVVRDAGPYVIDIMLDDDPAHVERPLSIRIIGLRGSSPLAGAAITVRGLPGTGTDATPTRTALLRPDADGYAGALEFAVRGAWSLEIRVAGQAGTGVATVPLLVAAPHAIPPWSGWALGLSPLVGLAWFAWWNVRYLGRLEAESVNP